MTSNIRFPLNIFWFNHERHGTERICDWRNECIYKILGINKLRNYMFSEMGIMCVSDKQVTTVLAGLCTLLGTHLDLDHYRPLITAMRENPHVELPGKYEKYFTEEIHSSIRHSLLQWEINQLEKIR